MSIADNNYRERVEDLLLQRAIFGLDPSEQSELEQLLSGFEGHGSLAFENVIGALDAGWAEEDSLKDGFEPLPEHLKAAILLQAKAGEADRGLTNARRPDPQVKTSGSASGWSVREKLFGLATAASLAVALFSVQSWLSGETRQVRELPLSEQWAMLESSATDLVKPDWTVADEKLAKGVTGSVIWSDQKQLGFMKFRGLARNQADKQQYQLWIFDANRSDAQPVDGGVFDIAADGEVIVPIEAKLDVSSAKMFAITIERPGGVVVSDRSQLPLLAMVQK